MSVAFGSSSFVSDGLVLYLDASNPKNYILTEAEVLVIGGGAGGSENQYDDGAGGGGGGFIQRIIQTLPSTAYTITVGSGGGAGGSGLIGVNSSAFGLIAYGGGGGAAHRSSGGAVDGASGGGSGGQYSADTPVVGRAIYGPEQGNDGGYSISYGGGGGGGAGGAGQGSITYGQGGHGGRGRSSSISGTLKYYSAGGGGWGYAAEGMGGLGGGGNSGTAPVQNTGSGGGGGKSTNGDKRATSGANGIVIIKYPGPQKATGGNTITQVGGYTIHTFTSTGTFTTLGVPANAGAVYGLQDLSGNNNTGTQSGGVTYSTADGGSLVFDGSNDYVDFGSDKLFKTTGGWTVSSWINLSQVNYGNLYNFIGASVINYHSWYWTVYQQKLALWNVSPGAWYFGNTTIQPATWYNAVLVCSDSGTQMTAYLNGVNDGGTLGSYSWNASYSGLKIGYIGRGDSGNGRYFYGKYPISSAYNRALTAAEILQNFNVLRGRFGI